MPDAVCVVPVEFVEDGPCQKCGQRRNGTESQFRHGDRERDSFKIHERCYCGHWTCGPWHPYQPPVVRRCGHPESQHVAEGEWDTEPADRPSLAQCLWCEIECKSVEDRRHFHTFDAGEVREQIDG